MLGPFDEEYELEHLPLDEDPNDEGFTAFHYDWDIEAPKDDE